MSARQILGTALFLALTVGLLLFLNRDRSGGEPPPDAPPTAKGADGPEPPPATSPQEPDPAGPAAEPAPPPPPAPQRVPPERFGAHKVAFTLLDSDSSPAEAFEAFGREIGYEISFTDTAWEVMENAGVALQLDDVSVSTVLALLTEPYECTWKVQGGAIWILMPGEEPPEPVR